MEKKEDDMTSVVEGLIRKAGEVGANGNSGADAALKLSQSACNSATAMRLLNELKAKQS